MFLPPGAPAPATCLRAVLAARADKISLSVQHIQKQDTERKTERKTKKRTKRAAGGREHDGERDKEKEKRKKERREKKREETGQTEERKEGRKEGREDRTRGGEERDGKKQRKGKNNTGCMHSR